MDRHAEHRPVLHHCPGDLAVRRLPDADPLTGLQSIPLELYEAARVDGATRWQAFRRITVPLLRPTLALLLVLSITGSLLAFDQFFILTQGQPDNSTITMVMVIYREAFFRSTSARPPCSRWSC